jgi:predicted LPLAT superfamily acyltransferase
VKQEWIERPETGNFFAAWLLFKFTFFFGRGPARIVLWPITFYFLLRRGPERRASRAYLTRVLGRPASLWEVSKHLYYFASVTLDRLFLVSGRLQHFEIRRHGVDRLNFAETFGRGVLMLGSHLGSVEALRALSEERTDVQFRAVMAARQTPIMAKILETLNPALAKAVIHPRDDGFSTTLAIKEALDNRAVVTMLADRGRSGDAVMSAQFLGAPAAFPTAPWLIAGMLKVPVVLCFGLYRGGNTYDVHFELFSEQIVLSRRDRERQIGEHIQRYADRLAHYVQSAPYNWFNYYDFWNPQALARDTADSSTAAAPAAPTAERIVRGA